MNGIPFLRVSYWFILIAIIGLIPTQAQNLAFPSAEGFGRHASGGRGGQIYIVTNLNDDGEGSLRKGIVKHGARTIVFAVSGTIDLKSRLDINRGDLTIAGQTAPGKGITIKGYPVAVKADNVIIRYMRFRMGDINGVQDDAFKGNDIENVILDHCSVSWATDENSSFYGNRNFTMQWCIISEALNNSVHEKGDHGYGGIWGGEKVSFHHNLIASNNSRNPRFSGSKTTQNSEGEFVDFRNNVIFNWGSNSIYGGENGTYNMVNNYFKPGPATTSSKLDRILEQYEPHGKFFISGNFMEGAKEISADNWQGVEGENMEASKLENEIAINENIKTQGAQEAFFRVLTNAGASYSRDAIDTRIVRETRTGNPEFGTGIIDSQEEVGGWEADEIVETPKDTDKDGMPDWWEKENKLNPETHNHSAFDLDENYTNIEVYINSLIPASEKYDIVVAKDGSGHYKTIQEAFLAVPDFRINPTTIFLKAGTYKEKLILPASKTNVHLIAENSEKTKITYDDYASKKNNFGEEIGTTGSSSFFVFGDGFQAKNITFENSSGPVGQAVAIRVDGDRVFFENCRFLGFQDTLYAHGKNSRQYYKNCYIEGTTDFIFGWSTAVFEDCEIYSKDGGHYITAASTEEDSKYGFIFINCKLTGDAPLESVYLGRPWRDHAQTVFINTEMGEHIKKEGWHNWSKPEAEKTAFYAEYNSTGPGAAAKKREKWSHQLNAKNAEEYSVENILKGNDNWQPKF